MANYLPNYNHYNHYNHYTHYTHFLMLPFLNGM